MIGLDTTTSRAATVPAHDISIVIVSWNTSAILAACLQSVYANLGTLRAEVWVVDNASTDGSPDMAKRDFPQTRLIRNTDNRGFAAANNQAIRDCTGRHVLLLNSDTVVLGDVLTTSVQYMDSHPDVGVFGCRVLNPDRTMQPTCFQYPTITNLVLKTSGLFRLPWPRFLGREHMSHWARDTERDVDVVTGCYMLVRAAALKAVGLLDESFFFCGEETDWCRRFREDGWRIRFAPVGEIIHIGNASGRSLSARRDMLLTEGLVRYHRKHGGLIGGAAAWLILLVFNATRALAWVAASMALRRDSARQRRDHFVEVVCRFKETWPSKAPNP